MAEFKTGDLVKLKSGGPTMTVQSVVDDRVYCQWFAGSKLDSGSFPRESLVRAEENDKGEKRKS